MYFTMKGNGWSKRKNDGTNGSYKDFFHSIDPLNILLSKVTLRISAKVISTLAEKMK